MIHLHRIRHTTASLVRPALAVAIMAGLLTSGVVAQQADLPLSGEKKPGQMRKGYLVSVPLPITDSVAAQLKQQLGRIADDAPVAAAVDQRDVLILEFDTANGATGRDSEIGNCLDLALLLTDVRMRGLYSVAYIPRASGLVPDTLGDLPPSRLEGHAVLVAMACNEIAMHEESALGRAGVDISGDSSIATTVYKNVTGRRLTLPSAVTQALVDAAQALYRVETSDGVTFADQGELDRLQAAGNVNSYTTLSKPGELPMFTSAEMQKLELIRQRVNSRTDLAGRFRVDPATVQGNPAAGGSWMAAQLPLGNYIDGREAAWTLRMLNTHLANNPNTNLLFVRLNCPGGEMDACLQIARTLADLDPQQIRTVAFVETTAAGASSLIATACDQIVIAESATLGGPDSVEPNVYALDDGRPLIKLLAEQKQRDWSVPMGLVDPELKVVKYKNKLTDQPRLLCAEERDALTNPDQWVSLGPVDLTTAQNASQAISLTLARSSVSDFEQLIQSYQLESAPRQLQPSPADRWIESLARQMATPWIAAWLLFGAVFLLSTEMSNPGIGIPGFLGSICLMLFFWSQYLDGNANWLEILLFAGGVVFVVLEVFVLPGFGIFGLGGLLMIVVSIVLASQTFIIPGNSQEMARLPVSLSLVLAATAGFFAAIFFFRKYLTTMPVFRRIMLQPPGHDETISPSQREQKESVVDRQHLLGRTGMTSTPLVPAGKAQIGNELVDVITDGRMVERGSPIRVVQVLGNRVIVEPETA